LDSFDYYYPRKVNRLLLIINGSGNDNIISGEGDDLNQGDTVVGMGSGDDNIISGEGNDNNNGNGGDDNIFGGEGDDQLTVGPGADVFSCGGGEDTVTDFNEAEGDIATPDCENI
jgi:Ca2+-binding RTX toxin-like protein